MCLGRNVRQLERGGQAWIAAEIFRNLPPTSPSECHSTVSNFKTELISPRAEPYYVIYRLYPPRRLSGGCLSDAVLLFLPLSSTLKGSESEGQPELRAAAPQPRRAGASELGELSAVQPVGHTLDRRQRFGSVAP